LAAGHGFLADLPAVRSRSSPICC